jgi:shikimate dehydrogenase
MSTRRLAVIGSPITHSLSPALHAAAYRALGLDWVYERHEVREHELRGFLDGLDGTWRGLSATMPLKEELARLCDEHDRTVALTGAANSLLIDDNGRRIARNTDVGGVERALRDAGLQDVTRAVIAGAGATARSVLVALDGFGMRDVTVALRDTSRAHAVVALAEQLGVDITLVRLDDLPQITDESDVVAWTLPNGVELPGQIPQETRQRAIGLDVTYHPWPGPLAAQWLAVGGSVASGRDMLLHQAVRQVRLFVSGQTEEPLQNEDRVEAAMAAALG